jgi:DNA-binding transcriptional ArsR family regulator
MNALDRALEAELLAQNLERYAQRIRADGTLSLGEKSVPCGSGKKSGSPPEPLADIARRIYAERALRSRIFDSRLFGEPAWDMLLDLYVNWSEGRKVCITSACIGSQVPHTTALRWIGILEEMELVERRREHNDKRVTYVELTDFGKRRIETFLRALRRESGSIGEPFLLAVK